MDDGASIAAVDLFCGAGGLSLGLKRAGIDVRAGVDLDPACKFAYEHNIGAHFFGADVAEVTAEQLREWWRGAAYTVLAGCAPCQPFSSHRRGTDTSDEKNWNLLDHFGRLVAETEPDFVTMENVTRLRRMAVFEDFTSELSRLGYAVDSGVLYGPHFGLPQERRRLVLVASRVGTIELPLGRPAEDGQLTVDATIGALPALAHGEADPKDPLHVARRLSPINLERMRASRPGGTWNDWPERLLAPCHRKASGASFKSFYGRMRGDAPSPTITTQAYNFGTGRFGHPSQDRSLTLREAAMLQGFPREYEFVESGVRPALSTVGRLIGNAVPPAFGEAVGRQIVEAARTALVEGVSEPSQVVP